MVQGVKPCCGTWFLVNSQNESHPKTLRPTCSNFHLKDGVSLSGFMRMLAFSHTTTHPPLTKPQSSLPSERKTQEQERRKKKNKQNVFEGGWENINNQLTKQPNKQPPNTSVSFNHYAQPQNTPENCITKIKYSQANG